MSRAWIAVWGAVWGAVALGCGGGQRTEPRPQVLKNEWTAPTMLAAVPADTPYLSASIVPMSPVQRWLTFDRADRGIVKLIQMAATLPPDLKRSELGPVERVILAFVDEVRDENLATWGQSLGFHASGRYILYGLSVWPVLRVEVADAPKLRGVVARLAAAAGPNVGERVFGAVRYWRADFPKIAVIAAVLDRELVLAVLPLDGVEPGLPLLFGTQVPARSLRDADKLSTLSRQYGLDANAVGYIDFRAFLDLFLRPPTAQATGIPAVLHPDASTVAKECRDELDMFAGLAPRLVFGQRELDTRRFQFTAVLEMPPSITTAIAGLQTATPLVVPGLDRRSLFSLGAAVDFNGLVRLLGRLTSHLEAQPLRCAWFAPIGSAVAELDQILDQVAPLTMLGIEGMAFAVDDFTIDPMTATGRAVVVADDAHGVLAAILSAVPIYNSLSIPPDGRPLELPVQLFGLPPQYTAHVLARPGRGVLTVGPASLAAARELEAAPAPPRSPLLSFSFHGPRLVALTPDDEEARADLSGLEHLSFQIEVSDAGLVGHIYASLLPPP